MKIVFNSTLLMLAMFFSQQSFATQYVVWGVKLQVYSQGHMESTAHMVEANISLYPPGEHTWCSRRAYVGINDKEIMVAVLSARLLDRPVNMIYDDAAAQVVVAGHTLSRCKVVSVFF
jgi:hypothetical protein